MGLNLSSIYQRPYLAKDNRNLVKKKQDEDASQSAAREAQREEQANQNARSKGLQYIENDGFTRSTSHIEAQPWQKELYQNAQAHQTQAIAQQMAGGRNSSINIAQILKDFRNTAIAIGTPDDLNEEVDSYLSLIEKQVSKDNPNIKRIKTDLKSASSILDEYISKTLNKDSKVVENWVDALFLQDIDFKYNEEDINPQFLVKFPEGSAERIQQKEQQAIAESETVQAEAAQVEEAAQTPQAQQETKTNVFIPQDSELKSLFIQSKKLAYAKEPKKAIETFQKALTRADEVGDTETKSKIFFEIGKIYDDYDYAAQALKSYHKSLEGTTDNNIKTKAHYSMAQIYDDVNQIEPALDHYYVSAAYGGESDNLAAQSTSLTRMGNIFADMYEDDAFEYLNTAQELADETDNHKVKGFVASSLGRAYEKFGEPQEALKSYSQAVKNYTEASSPLKAAQNYVSAADIMIDFNSTNKARSLLNKAQKFAQEAQDESLLNEINERLAGLNSGSSKINIEADEFARISNAA